MPMMKQVWMVCLAVLLLGACHRRQSAAPTARSVYYWRTTLRLDSAERAFLRQHDVRRLYLRYFDVVPDDGGKPVPNATLAFSDTLPGGVEVVPVVFVLNDCMRGNVDSLPDLILRRVLQMCETHDVKGVRELQIDCDWTMQTQRRYFELLDRLRKLCHDRDMRLSTTIRLHQLSLDVPPADRGVLMMYNTGDVTRLDVQKPILDICDVRPYLHSLPGYRLPLATAYPLFAWQVLFRGGRFVGIMHGDDDLPVLGGDSIVTRSPSVGDIMAVRQAVDERRPEAHGEVILYDLSNENIHRFNTDEYEKIYQGE